MSTSWMGDSRVKVGTFLLLTNDMKRRIEVPAFIVGPFSIHSCISDTSSVQISISASGIGVGGSVASTDRAMEIAFALLDAEPDERKWSAIKIQRIQGTDKLAPPAWAKVAVKKAFAAMAKARGEATQ